jgi:NAD(P)-dependent dehydrogenase (short-subunit alcohol dehydrogenase family)
LIIGHLGARLAVQFLNEGYFVFAGVKSLDDISPLQRNLPINLKHNLIPIEIDAKFVSKTVQIVEASLKSLPPNARILIGLINNSIKESESLEPLESINSDIWIRMFTANVVEPFNLINGFLPLLRHCNGRIINIIPNGSNTCPLQGAYGHNPYDRT